MSCLGLGGSAVTELDTTTGKVFTLSSIQAGGQLSLHLHPLHWHIGNGCGEDKQRAAMQTLTMSASRSLIPGVPYPGRPLRGRGEDLGRTRRGLHLTAVGRSGGFGLKGLVHPLAAAHWLSIPSALDPDAG